MLGAATELCFPSHMLCRCCDNTHNLDYITHTSKISKEPMPSLRTDFSIPWCLYSPVWKNNAGMGSAKMTKVQNCIISPRVCPLTNMREWMIVILTSITMKIMILLNVQISSNDPEKSGKIAKIDVITTNTH